MLCPLAAALPLLLLIPGCAVDPNAGVQPVVAVKAVEDPCAKAGTGTLGANNVDQRRCALAALVKEHGTDATIGLVVVSNGELPSAAAVALAGANMPPTSATSLAPGGDNVAAGLSVTVRDSGKQFAPGSDKLTPEAESLFRDMAAQYSFTKQSARLAAAATPPTDDDHAGVEALKTRRILVVGHTDDVGNSADDANLAERRAVAVARVFQQQGVPVTNLFYQGAGETLPVADNRTDEGRAANRRIEIVDVGDDSALRKFLATRRQVLQFYRSSAPTAAGADVKPGAIVVPPPPKGKVAVARSRALAAAAAGAGFIDFGGTPVVAPDAASATPTPADFGAGVVGTPSAAGTAGATAADSPIAPPCNADRPRIANGVRSLATQKDLPAGDYVPGLYNTSWSDTLNGNLIGLTNVDVLRDGGSPSEKPTMLILKNYNSKRRVPATDFQVSPDVNVYRGSRAILYRVFVTGPMKCMDVVFPYSDVAGPRHSTLSYDKMSMPYTLSFELKSVSAQ